MGKCHPAWWPEFILQSPYRIRDNRLAQAALCVLVHSHPPPSLLHIHNNEGLKVDTQKQGGRRTSHLLILGETKGFTKKGNVTLSTYFDCSNQYLQSQWILLTDQKGVNHTGKMGYNREGRRSSWIQKGAQSHSLKLKWIVKTVVLTGREPRDWMFCG